MEKFTSKRRTKPTEVCQYGKNCYRKNPHHFIEYRHEHLDKIMEQKTENQYVIPDEILGQKDLIIDQIKVINELFPPEDKEPSAKKNKPTEQNITMPKTSTHVENDVTRLINQFASSSSSSTPQKVFVPKVDIHKYIDVVAPKGKMAEKLEKSRPFNFFLTCISSSRPTHDEPLSITFQEILDQSLGELECSVQINFMVEIGWLVSFGIFFFIFLSTMIFVYSIQV